MAENKSLRETYGSPMVTVEFAGGSMTVPQALLQNVAQAFVDTGEFESAGAVMRTMAQIPAFRKGGVGPSPGG